MRYEDAKRLLRDLEVDSEVLYPVLHGWLAWSVVKRALFHGLLGKTDVIEQAVSPARRLLQVVEVSWGAFIGMCQLARNIGLLAKPHIFVYSQADARSMPDHETGTHRNVFFDDLLLSGQLRCPALLAETSVTGKHRSPTKGLRLVHGEVLYLLIRVLSAFVPKRACVEVTQQLVEAMAKREPLLAEPRFRCLVYQYTLRFAVERMLYGWYFRCLPVKAVMILDAMNRPGLLAAARENAVPVYDFQHGVIGRYHAAYWIDACLEPHKAKIPLPTKIMVYGKLWKRLFEECGFWEPGEVVCVGSARMDRFRFRPDSSVRRDCTPVVLVYTSQWISRLDAMHFWREFLSRRHPFDYKLIIKVHPLEWEGVAHYKTLESVAPGRCEVVYMGQDTYELLGACDIHISYQSSVLVESVAIGRPTVSIRGSASPRGFLGGIGLPELADAIIQIDTVSEMSEIVSQYAEDSAFRKAMIDRVSLVGQDLFTTGFIERVAAQVNSSLDCE